MYDYTPIRIAILQQAIKDYKIALKQNNFGQRARLEKFFLSGWGQLLSEGHGEYIIYRCKKEIGKK